MSEFLYHPFTFVVHALLLGAALFFVHQACAQLFLFHSSRRRTLLVYAALAGLAALNCIVTFLPILPIGKMLKVQMFHFMWIIGALLYFTYIEALRRYLRLPADTLKRTQGLIMGLITIPLGSSVALMVTGRPFLYDLAPSAAPGILFAAIGNPFSSNAFTSIYVLLQGGVAIFVSVAFIRMILARKKRDYYVVAGLLMTILCLAAEMAMAGGRALYSMPLLVFAHIIEIFRITYVSTTEVSEEVAKLTEVSSRQKKIIEEQLDELEVSEKLSVLGEMTGGLSHEIKGPLQTIRGYLELTEASLEQPAALDEQEIRQYIAKSSMAVDHINDIISAVNRFASKDREGSFERIELHTLIDSALELCAFNLRWRDVTIRRELPNASIYVSGSRTQLVQVLINLINNACDAVADLNERSIAVSVVTTTHSAFISVTDSGKGIAPEVRKSIGKAFFSTKPGGRNQGLGLRISTRILQRHEGRLFIDESCPNTRFVVELPLQLVNAAPAQV